MQAAKPLGMLLTVRNQTVTDTPPTKLSEETAVGGLLHETFAPLCVNEVTQCTDCETFDFE